MKTKKSELQHITGEQAYRLYWQQVYECRPRLSTVMAIDTNLEIIVDFDLKILAYRHELPEDMFGMTSNEGLWRLFGEAAMSDDVRDVVKRFIAMLRLDYSCN